MRTWGDELTLRAASDCFGCTIHVVTSHEANWYLRYAPAADSPPEAAEKSPARRPAAGATRKPQPGSALATAEPLPVRMRSKVEWHGKNVFLVYVSPVHYDALALASARSPPL